MKSLFPFSRSDGPSLRRGYPWIHAGIISALAVVFAAGGLEAAILAVDAHAPRQDLASVAPAPSWTEINHPFALYALAGTDYAKLPLVYRARRHRPDGAREDVLTYGTSGTAKPYLQLALLRQGEPGPRAEDGISLDDDLARLAGTGNLTVSRIRSAAPVATRFGRIDAADLLLWDGGTATPCLGFRGEADGESVLRIAGFACGTPERPLGRAALACAIDRIDLVAAGDDQRLRAAFVAAERRAGSACGAVASAGGGETDLLGASGLLAMAGRRATWLDPQAELPPMRGPLDVSGRKH